MRSIHAMLSASSYLPGAPLAAAKARNAAQKRSMASQSGW